MTKLILMGLSLSLLAVSCKKNTESTQSKQDTIVKSVDTLSTKKDSIVEVEKKIDDVAEQLDLSQIKQMAINDFNSRTDDLISRAIAEYNKNSTEEYPHSRKDVKASILEVYTGDLSGDGLEDIVIWFESRSEEDRHPLENGVLLYKNKRNNVEYVKKLSNGGLDGYSNVEIRNGKAVLTYLLHKDEDPYCCPTGKHTETVSL